MDNVSGYNIAEKIVLARHQNMAIWGDENGQATGGESHWTKILECAEYRERFDSKLAQQSAERERQGRGNGLGLVDACRHEEFVEALQDIVDGYQVRPSAVEPIFGKVNSRPIRYDEDYCEVDALKIAQAPPGRHWIQVTKKPKPYTMAMTEPFDPYEIAFELAPDIQMREYAIRSGEVGLSTWIGYDREHRRWWQSGDPRIHHLPSWANA